MQTSAFYVHELGEWSILPNEAFGNMPVVSFEKYFSESMIASAGFLSVAVIGGQGTGKTECTREIVNRLGFPTKIITGSVDDYIGAGKTLTQLRNGSPVEVISDTLEQISGLDDLESALERPAEFIKQLDRAQGGALKELIYTIARYNTRTTSGREATADDAYTLVLDDISEQLKSPRSGTVKALEFLLKKMRHIPMNVIVTAHTPYDIANSLRTLFRYVVFTGSSGPTKGTMARDLANYFGGMIEYPQMKKILEALPGSGACIVYKSGYNPDPDNKTLYGTPEIPGVPSGFFKTPKLHLVVKEGLFRKPPPADKPENPLERRARTSFPEQPDLDDELAFVAASKALGIKPKDRKLAPRVRRRAAAPPPLEYANLSPRRRAPSRLSGLGPSRASPQDPRLYDSASSEDGSMEASARDYWSPEPED